MLSMIRVSRGLALGVRPMSSWGPTLAYLPSMGSLSPFKRSRQTRIGEQTGDESSDSAKAAEKLSMKTLLFGTEENLREEEQIERGFSSVMSRGKFVHEISRHSVKADKVEEYVELVSRVFPQIAADKENKIRLVGSWSHQVGDLDTFTHIWEYQGYDGYKHAIGRISKQDIYVDYLKQLRPLLRSRKCDFMLEFKFWGGTAAPRKMGGIFELRRYDLKPGYLLEWETHWRKGIEYRRKVMEPVGAWFTQLGSLNTVYHLWQFADLYDRSKSREKSWSQEGWADTVHKTVPLINTMRSEILLPLSFSPLQ